MYLFFDMLFMSWLLIVIGGLTTTICLYLLASREFSLSDKKRLGILEFGINEEKRLREKEEEKLKKLIIENYAEIIKLQDELFKLQKMNNEKD